MWGHGAKSRKNCVFILSSSIVCLMFAFNDSFLEKYVMVMLADTLGDKLCQEADAYTVYSTSISHADVSGEGCIQVAMLTRAGNNLAEGSMQFDFAKKLMCTM